MHYSIGIELFDYDGSKPLNILKYNSLNDVVGKILKLSIDLKKASAIPEKLSHEVQCRYNWLDEEKTQFETKVVEGGAGTNPQFAYRTEHTIEVDEDLISKMIENTLRVGVYGKVEQKKKAQQPVVSIDADGKLHVIDEMPEEDGAGSPTKGKNVSINTSKLGGQVLTLEEIERLRKEHAEMME